MKSIVLALQETVQRESVQLAELGAAWGGPGISGWVMLAETFIGSAERCQQPGTSVWLENSKNETSPHQTLFLPNFTRRLVPNSWTCGLWVVRGVVGNPKFSLLKNKKPTTNNKPLCVACHAA